MAGANGVERMPEQSGEGRPALAWPVIGHEDVTGLLRQSIRRDRVSHAYLMAGPAGVGKSTVALAFAQALCCQATDRPDPTVACTECLACRKIARGVHPDVQVVDLEWQTRAAAKRSGQNTTLTIDTVRQLAADAALKPMEANRRIIIVDDAEAMAEIAQEALLKTLEEPPPSVLLMLLADNAGVLLPTIQSRCQVIGLRLVAPSVIAGALEAAGVVPETARELAMMALGRPGWALTAAADPGQIEARRAATERALAWIEGSSYSRLVTAIKHGDSYAKRRSETLDDLETLLAIWRDAMLIRVDRPDLAIRGPAMERLGALADGWSLEVIARAIRSVQRCQADLETNVRPRLALQTMVLTWPAA